MKVNDDVYVIKLPMTFGGHTMELNLSLILDPVGGPILVDTGVPGQEKLIADALPAAGTSIGDLKRILLTHQDLDHIGSMFALREETGATILASEIETPYIQGDKPGYKTPPPERLAEMPELKAAIDAIKRCPIDQELQDGDRIDSAGGIKIIATPGHTPGHISLYLERTKTLITGDALVSDNGTLQGPMAQATPDMPTAIDSVRKLAELDVDTIICYHGGLVTEDANGQLQRVLAELTR